LSAARSQGQLASGAPAGRLARAAASAAACLALFAFAVWVRGLRRALVLAPEGVLPVDGDSFYHFRRIAFSVRNFPALLGNDAYVNFPHGGEPIWAPTFDFALAALVRVALGEGDPAAMERFLCFVPAVLGGLQVALLFLLGRRLVPAPAAFAAALLLGVLPAHFVYSQVGFVDHHVAVSLAGTLLLLAAMGFVARPGRAQAAWLGRAMAAARALWPGALIHVGFAQAALLGFLVSRAERGAAVAAARRLAAAHALAAAALLPLCLGQTWIRWGAVSPLVLSNFQPLWLGAGALCFALLGELWRRAGMPRGMPGRAMGAAALGAAVLALCVAALPELARSGAADAWAWLARGEEFQANVSESQPLLGTADAFSPWSGVELLSGGLLLAPVAALALLVLAVRRGRPELGVLGFLGAALLGLALAQGRFAVDLAPALALLLAAAASAGLEGLSGRAHRPVVATAAALALVLCLPVLDWYRSLPASGGARVRRMELVVEAGRWLRAHSPPTSGWLEAGGTPPEYGVLGPWGWGHALRYAAQRPMVQDNFGDDVGAEGWDAAEAYFRADSEFAGLARLERLRVRYVVVGPTGSGHGRGYPPTSLFARLRQDGGPAPAASGGSLLAASSLFRHRLVYESEPFEAGGRRPYLTVFEVVRGARLGGSAAPGALVEARLALRTRRRELGFVARAAADAAGRYLLVLPYASGARGEVTSASYYELRSGGKVARAAVTEEQVQRGDRVEAPALESARSDTGERRG
jgi:dolichyl-diphosphooligosaccharide--protein glycosyltransferase